ncbi:replication fork protection complex subunit csm3 swi3 [Trichoderma cornu-damae]|uniref:Replication fork protection complex subunit csm3 swi3 n=1 Tax=Trichoderma cornu-damae TaxID=654480 RepID=A0A9P8QPB8_9HYPO|nr:replication fork protection complex subunit csm3 swi3 [Trichoderma cornu-damae]
MPMPSPFSTERQPAHGDDLDDYGHDEIMSDSPVASPTPQQQPTGTKRKEPDPGLGIDEEVSVKMRRRDPLVKLDEERYFSDTASLLSLYQLWLDDLFPKARFLDALTMVEKVGHKKVLMIARNEWINQERHKLSGTDDGDVEMEVAAVAAMPAVAEGSQGDISMDRAQKTPERYTVPDDDLYDATPRTSPRHAEPRLTLPNDVPDDHDPMSDAVFDFADDEEAMLEMEGLLWSDRDMIL